jgi:hypothetical protein
VRSLVQSYLSTFLHSRIALPKGRSISFPVLVGAVFFGFMHIVLWPRLGPAALIPIALATLLVRCYIDF